MNKHMYILADGGRIAASDPSEFVRVLREGSWFDSGCTDGEYMVNFSGRYRELHGAVSYTHLYGAETNAHLDIMLGKDWKLDMNGTFSWTPSINESEPMSPADQSVGKQLPYVPEFSATVTGRLSWRYLPKYACPFCLPPSRKIPSALPKGYYVFRRLRWWANDL